MEGIETAYRIHKSAVMLLTVIALRMGDRSVSESESSMSDISISSTN